MTLSSFPGESKVQTEPRILPPGNCPYCDSLQGRNGGWGMGPDGWAQAKVAHDARHPTFAMDNRCEGNGSIEGGAGLRGLSGDTLAGRSNLPHAERPGLPTLRVGVGEGDAQHPRQGPMTSLSPAREGTTQNVDERLAEIRGMLTDLTGNDSQSVPLTIGNLRFLLAYLDEACKDSARIDWVEAHPKKVNLYAVATDGKAWWRSPRTIGHTSFRNAVDAAMSPSSSVPSTGGEL